MISELESNLRRHVAELAERIGERNVWRRGSLTAAAHYIQSVWQAQGYTVTAHTCCEMRGEPCVNLEVTIAGQSRANEIVLIGAHYDTVPSSPGANDNASGVAALLEIARLLQGDRLAQTLRLVAFVNEEAPFFRSKQMGSEIYARSARARADNITLMLSLEMLAAPAIVPGLSWSDHRSFWQAGYRAARFP